MSPRSALELKSVVWSVGALNKHFLHSSSVPGADRLTHLGGGSMVKWEGL